MKARQAKIKSRVFKELHSFRGKIINEAKLVQHLRKKIKRRNDWEIEFSEILHDLVALNLIKIKESEVKFEKNLIVEGKVSLGPRGNAFISCALEKEIHLSREQSFYLYNGQQVTVELTDYFRKRFTGKLIRSEYLDKSFLCQSIHESSAGTLACIVTQADKQQVFIRGKQLASGTYFNAVQSDEVAIHKKSLPEFIKFIEYDYVKILEFSSYYDIKNEEHILERIINQFNLPAEYHLQPSIEKALKQRFKEGLTEKSRTDLTSLPCFTIDGETAKDFDDAISFEIDEKSFTLYVHIADVSFYVKESSDLDIDARSRGNSTYLHPAVLPMLPKILSEDLCSLVPKKKRLAATAKLVYDLNYEIIHTSFFRSIIKVDKRYTYGLANQILSKPNSELAEISHFCQQLGVKRNAAGRIRLENSESTVFTSEQLIEECMLSANVEVAKYFRNSNRSTILRVHPPVAKDQLEKLNSIFTLYDLPLVSHETLATDLQSAIQTAYEKYPNIPFSYLILRTFSIASYQTESKGHWGLAFSDYLHFTSPIRRYADLQVHRQLFDEPSEQSSDELLEEVCKRINETERTSMQAERELQKIRGAIELINSLDSTFSAVITGVSSQKVFVLLNEQGIEGIIEPIFMKCEEFILMNEYQLTIPGTNKVFTIGQPVTVTLKKVEPILGKLYFTL